MILIAMLTILALLALAGYWWWSRPSPARGIPPLRARAVEQFASVEIRRGRGACPAAHALSGQRFL